MNQDSYDMLKDAILLEIFKNAKTKNDILELVISLRDYCEELRASYQK